MQIAKLTNSSRKVKKLLPRHNKSNEKLKITIVDAEASKKRKAFQLFKFQ